MSEKGEAPSLKMAYVPLWFPLSSETFIFREVRELQALGVDIHVYTMYGKRLRGCSRDMCEYPGPIFRMGTRSFFSMGGAFFRAVKKNPGKVWGLARRVFFRHMRNLESLAENSWCFLAGFLLAEKCASDGIDLIHSPWANGPATAALVASSLSGIPFAFTGRAGDIYPQDGILDEKAKIARFIRANNAANMPWLASFCPTEEKDKVKLIYNGLTFKNTEQRSNSTPKAPYRILAVGRFARTKGFPQLFTALARLRREGFPIELTLVGDGNWHRKLKHMRAKLGLEDCVAMPGFVPNDRLVEYMRSHDLLVVPSVVHSNGDRDGIPNVIMEACSMCLPVVATDVCGISEVIRNGETGWLVPQRNPAALANAIRGALENWSESAAMAQTARQLVLQMFDSRKNSLALRDLYRQTIQSGADA